MYPFTINNESFASFSLWTSISIVVLIGIVVYWIGRIKIGITRKLGFVIGNDRRRLGLLERWYIAHSRTRMHTGFTTCVEVEIPANSEQPNVPQVKEILCRVAHRFPWLCARVKRDNVNGKDDADVLKKVNTLHTSSRHDDEQQKEPLWGDDFYVQVIDQASFTHKDIALDHIKLDQKYEENNDGDAMKSNGLCKILEKWKDRTDRFALILSFHHLITDGIGASAIINAILDESSAVTSLKSPTTESNNDKVLPSPLLPPPMEDLMDTVPQLGHLFVPVLLDRVPSLAPYLKPPHWKGRTTTTDKIQPRKSQLVCINLLGSQAHVIKLRDACRSQGYTITSICVSTLAAAIRKTVNKNVGEHQSEAISKNGVVTLKITVATNERPNCGGMVNAADLGCYVCGPQVFVNVGGSKSSAHDNSCQLLASKFHKSLKSKRRDAAMDMGLCAFIRQDWIQFAKAFADDEPNGIHESIEFSNVGAVDLETVNKPSLSSWKPINYWFAQGRQESGAAITVAVCSGPGGLNATLSAFPQALTREELEQIGMDWKEEIKRQITIT